MKHLFFMIPLAAALLFGGCNNTDDEGQPGRADLELSFEPITEKPNIGDVVTFQAKLFNRGPLAADGVTVENTVPEGFTQVGDINAGGVFTAPPVIRWAGLSIQPEETITLSFTAVAGKPGGDIGFTHSAQVTASNQPDPDSTPNNASGAPKEDDEAVLHLIPLAGEVSLNFKASYGQDPLVMFEREYAYEDNMAIKMQLFQFYLSEVNLLREDERVPVMDVGLISFGDVYTDEQALAGKSSGTLVAPPGNYTGIEFGFGLTPELNATIPPDYPLGHPLSENYWEAASSYIFFKFEGNADLEPNGEFSDKLTFHVGGNGNYRQLSFDKPIAIEDEKELTLQFNIDLQKMLVDQNTGEYLDFRQVTQSHSNESPSATFLADHVAEAVELE
ncbi:MAG: hypothetical protein J5I94_03450 [Phaeodactylibacter sp.]|nr:hypothetical protein [Phaeodactylibacter sp.]